MRKYISHPKEVEFLLNRPTSRMTCFDVRTKKPYFDIILPEPRQRITAAMPDRGTYVFKFEGAHPQIVHENPIKKVNIPVAEPERYPRFHRAKRIIKKVGTPDIAKTNIKTGVIYTGKMFDNLPTCVQKFVLLHEVAHDLYDSEEKADQWALASMMAAGYSPAQCIYSLINHLVASGEKDERIEHLTNLALKHDK